MSSARALKVRAGDDASFSELYDRVLDDFLACLSEGHAGSEPVLRSGEGIAGAMLDWKCGHASPDDHGFIDLGAWTVGDVSGYMLELLPHSAPSEEQLIADAPECVIRFLRFLRQRGQLSGDPIEALDRACVALRPKFEEAMRDRTRWGTGKALLTQMHDEGRDIADPEEFQAWLAEFNSRPYEERDRVVRPALAGLGPALAAARARAELDPDPVVAPGEWLELDDAELARIEAEVEDERRHARELLVRALRGRWQAAPPPQVGDPEGLIDAVAETISPEDIEEADVEELSLIGALEPADWIGAVVSAVRAGPGAPADPASLVAGIHACPEIELAPEFDPESDELVETAFGILEPSWQELGVLDLDSRLTALGAWVLPRALLLVYGGERGTAG